MCGEDTILYSIYVVVSFFVLFDDVTGFALVLATGYSRKPVSSPRVIVQWFVRMYIVQLARARFALDPLNDPNIRWPTGVPRTWQ